MSKEKQIEEMKKDLCECQTIDEWAAREYGEAYTDFDATAEKMLNRGWIKQSEGEWLPSPDGIQPIRCSKCNMPAPFVAGENEFDDFEICRYQSRYCHECGAKMFVRMTHTCPHNIPNLIPTIEELLKGGAE